MVALSGALLAALVAAALGVLMAVGVPAGASAAPRAGLAEADQVFVGRVQGVEKIEGPSPDRTRMRFEVNVLIVFGDSTVDDTMVTVLSEPGLDRCANFPKTERTERYLFRVSERSGRLIATACGAISEFSRQDQADVVARFGAARQPGPPAPPQPPTPTLEPVSYLCPDTGEALPAIAEDAADCPALEAPAATDRAAAPGLALVIVGVLGLFVVRRLRRSRA